MLSFFPLFCCVAGLVRERWIVLRAIARRFGRLRALRAALMRGVRGVRRMRPMLHAVAAGAAALSLYLGCHAAGAKALEEARVITSTYLPGGKYSVVYEYAGVEYFAISPTLPGETIAVTTDAAKIPQPRWMRLEDRRPRKSAGL